MEQFEPSVPRQGSVNFLIRDVPVSSARPDVLEVRANKPYGASERLLLHGGTDSSNLLSSNGGSCANCETLQERVSRLMEQNGNVGCMMVEQI